MRIWVTAVVLTMACSHAQPRRPQTPQAPFPYRTEEVRVRSKAAGGTLACTLSIPEGEGTHPAMVLVTGSGPQDRDETVFGHKPFLVIADYLARNGGNRQVTVRRFPGLNHLFQTAKTGAPDEYGKIPETIAPVVLETIVNWLRELNRN